MARLLLASREIPLLAGLLRPNGRRAVLVPTASNPVGEPETADEVQGESHADAQRAFAGRVTMQRLRDCEVLDVGDARTWVIGG